MKIILTLAADEAVALRRFANATGEGLEGAAQIALREFLIEIGALEAPYALDEDTETVGEA